MKKALKRLAVFASGRGSNFENIARQVKKGKIRAEIALFFSDNPDAPAMEKAKKFRIEALALSPKNYSSKEIFEKEVVRILNERRIDIIVLAGYMRILGPDLIRAFPQRIVNIHPALLPAFKGAHAIRDAYEYGAQVTGVTVHYVDAQVDHGPIILQKEVKISPKDSLDALEKKVHKLEYKLYPRAIKLLVAGKFKIVGRKVLIFR